MKTNYDQTACRNSLDYKKEHIVVKTTNEKVWENTLVIEKAKEPRSYWFEKNCNKNIVMRNVSYMKPTITKPEIKSICEPVFY